MSFLQVHPHGHNRDALLGAKMLKEKILCAQQGCASAEVVIASSCEVVCSWI